MKFSVLGFQYIHKAFQLLLYARLMFFNTVQLHPIKSKFKVCVSSNLARSLSGVCDGKIQLKMRPFVRQSFRKNNSLASNYHIITVFFPFLTH